MDFSGSCGNFFAELEQTLSLRNKISVHAHCLCFLSIPMKQYHSILVSHGVAVGG